MAVYTLGPSHLNSREYEVQRANNFEIWISDLPGASTLTLAVESGFLPSESNEEITLAYGNRNVKVAGKATYETGTVNIKDFIGADTEATVVAWRRQVYDARNDKVGFAATYKKDAIVMEYSPDGSIVRTWRFEGVWPQAVNYGELDYNNSEKKQISLTLSYDRAWRE